METILEKIVTIRRGRLEQERAAVPLNAVVERAAQQAPPRSLRDALAGPGIHVIAEVKKASPSRGLLRPDFDPAALARAYKEGSAAALSVLTEEDHFMGSLSVLETVWNTVTLPILRKDFIFDRYQVIEARAAGADSFLLIAGILELSDLRALIAAGRAWNMEPLVEVHDRAELDKAVEAEAAIIGINNRDLKTFRVDLNTTLELIAHVPNDRLVVSESGIKTHEDAVRLTEAGVSALLVGESLVISSDPRAKLIELIHG